MGVIMRKRKDGKSRRERAGRRRRESTLGGGGYRSWRCVGDEKGLENEGKPRRRERKRLYGLGT